MPRTARVARKLAKSSRGFTLIELLVVIAIIGLLASIIYTALGASRNKGKNTRLISDAGQIRNEMEAEASVTGVYPGNNAVSGGGAENLSAAPWITSGPLFKLKTDVLAQAGNAALKVYQAGPRNRFAIYVIFVDAGGYCADSGGNAISYDTGDGFAAASNSATCPATGAFN